MKYEDIDDFKNYLLELHQQIDGLSKKVKELEKKNKELEEKNKELKQRNRQKNMYLCGFSVLAILIISILVAII